MAEPGAALALENERRTLPSRTTRGKRLRAQLEDEEEQADNEFWGQEFFAEDARDADYVSEKEEEDVPDSDFFESESEEDEDDGELEVRSEPKKKTLRPPGAPPARPRPPPRPPVKEKLAGAGVADADAGDVVAGAAAGDEDAAGATAAPLSRELVLEAMYEAPKLRKSTRERVEVMTKEREERELMARAVARPKKAGGDATRILTQAELLAEAARTELENLASLKLLLAQEEETKRKANAKKARYGGPLVRLRSRGVDVAATPELLAALPAEALEAHAEARRRARQREQERKQQQEEKQRREEAEAAGAVTEAALQEEQPEQLEQKEQQQPEQKEPEQQQPEQQQPEQQQPEQQQPEQQQPEQQQPQQQQPEQQQPEQQQEQSTGQPGLQEPQSVQLQQTDPGDVDEAPSAVRLEVTTLQCFGMKPPRWLQPQRVLPRPAQPLCAISGAAARYVDPLTGHYYAAAPAFRELRRRLGQPLPDAAQPRGACSGDDVPPLLANASAGAGCFPAAQQQLEQMVGEAVQRAAEQATGRGARSKGGLYPQQLAVPDEVAALVLSVAQLVHSGG
jgi:YL1 nuclear protein/YL1 nuclear protein C-terminal domain